MAVIKCKMCGGDLILVPGSTVAECESCGTRQTIPVVDNEKKLTLFARANRLRAACEFDKAAGIYEAIVADFPEEAEAYWGLVLCKYGIEYVDDPATGKKVPTCHRSSFESVLDDPNFEQAQENADAIARKLYREEAKQIEELRKGIIEVSTKEEPYDIFICYKETDENGERTIDSVIAQDVYDALTEKGYRVFFSRITLEDKLGQEYEPYIFAALNSAKIMLAFGTDFEYFNAVWVKNEWSRYLKLMASDKNKHLIPCYKNIDAYDMPKEFAKLQAQDMGKVGAMQDLLRGIEKILPKAAPTTVIQEKVIVGGSGENKIASLLDRGNMALEDGDWAKADSFFEDVLNNDSKNAQAYLGKTLAQQRCRTIDALVRKRLNQYEQATPEMLTIPEQTEYIDQAVESYTVPGYVSGEKIRKLYVFNQEYASEVSSRQEQYHQEETWWAEHKQLSRAEKFATGAVAENLAAAKKALFAALADRVKKAQQAEAENAKKQEAIYNSALQEMGDRWAENAYKNGLRRREEDYTAWLEKAKREQDPKNLLDLAKKFARLDDYKDSRKLAEHCRKQAAEEQAEAQRQRKAQEEADRVRAERNQKLALVAAIVVTIALVLFLVVTRVVIPGNSYKKAEALLASGNYDEAIEAFEALGDYKDSAERISEVENIAAEAAIEEQYVAAKALVAEGKYDDAIAAFEALGDYKDSQDQIIACQERMKENQYQAAVELLNEGKNAQAAMVFYSLEDYQDARQRSNDLWNAAAVRETIRAGIYHSIGLRSNGTVVAVGDNEKGQCDVSDWTNIVAVSAGLSHSVGLKADGTVVALGRNTEGECDTSHWADIVAICAGTYHTVGLKADGSVVATGYNEECQCNVDDWTDIVAISAGRKHTVGLKADGTVVTAGGNDEGQCSVEDWTDIVAICAGWNYTVGLKSNGTVIAVGANEKGQCDIAGWTDIVAISADSYHTIGLKADGTVVTAGYNGDGQCDVDDWTDIVAISTGAYHTIGLKADGTVVAVGDNLHGRCDVDDWTNIKLPNK